MTRSQIVAADIAALLRARNPLLWIVTREEARAEQYIIEACASANYVPRFWDVGAGVTDIAGKAMGIGSQEPNDTLNVIRNFATTQSGIARSVWIMRDLPPWLIGLPGAAVCRNLRNLARLLPTTPRETAQSVIVLTPSAEIPPELAGHATVIEWPLPDRDEIAELLDSAIESLPDNLKAQAAPNGQRDAAIDAAVGLSGEEAQACYARSLIQLQRIDPATVAREKKRVIEREKVLEYFAPLPGGLESVGGLENLKAWFQTRTNAYSPAARAYGLPAPKGVLLVGISGCGKSYISKAIATFWGIPLLKVDFGALKSKFVGESEGNFRKALRVIEAIGRCVVWIDEIEKALQGATSGSADGGVSADALGTFLTWMQERQGQAFVIATANDVSGLPPELLRKGRFDEIFFVDLPNVVERNAILFATLKSHGRQLKDVSKSTYDLAQIGVFCDGFTGSEIAAIVPDAMFAAFSDNQREITTKDLVAAAKTVVPLSTTAKEKIDKLREWAATRARPANAATTQDATPIRKRGGRSLDI